MTVEELKAEAKKLGYRLIPIPKQEPFLPCTCGCNRRTHWVSSMYGVETSILRCMKCNKEARGSSEAEARRNWNEMIRKENNEL